jgi:preprotein translocase subunit SecE
VFAASQHGRDAWKFVLDSRIELYKVFWPTRQETLMTTLVVFGFVGHHGLFFWGMDCSSPGHAFAARHRTGG